MLIALHEDVQPAEYVLAAGPCSLGRSPLCQVVVHHRKAISRLHARIETEGPRYVLHDHNSANGTFVNGARIAEPYLLKDRDRIGLGTPTALLRFVDSDPTHVVASRLRYDDKTMTFYLEERPLSLTPQQFRLLSHLYQHAGEVCTRERCAEAIWGRDYDPGMDADALDRAIANLRAQLRQVDPNSDLIQTRRGLGYVLELYSTD
jgi:DNA-binding response OmpR family regulator